MYNAVVVGADLVAAELAMMAATQGTKEAGIVRHFGQLYQTRVRARASGRPGPRAITGDYRRSITMEMTTVGGATAALVSSNAPQARRLERGFIGVDSLGRHYAAPPFPHWEPDLERTVEEMAIALAATVVT